MAENNPRPRISTIVPLPVSLLLIVFFFLPWLTLSCNSGELTKAMQTSGGAGMLEVTAKIAQASGWQLANGDISLKVPQAQKDNTFGADNNGLKSRSWLYIALAAPVLALLLSGLGVTGNLNAGTVGKGLLLLGIVGTVTILAVASIDYVDDAIDKMQDDMPKSSRGGPAPYQQDMGQAKAEMKKFVKTEGTVYLWSSLGMYVLLAGCGFAARTAPLELGFEQDAASASAAAYLGPLERIRQPDADRLPDFGPDLIPAEPARETEDSATVV